MKRKIVLFIIILLFVISLTNIVEAKYVVDIKREIARIDIDRTPPKGIIKYSTTDITNENVVVTIIFDEAIKEITGWDLQKDKKTIKKEFEKNQKEIIYVFDIYDNGTSLEIDVNNIDKDKPLIDILNISNDNKGYENFANKNNKISIDLKIEDNNIQGKELEKSKLHLLIGDNNIDEKISEFYKISEIENQIIYRLGLSDLEGNGNLYVEIDDGIIMDDAGNGNDAKKVNTNIIIDNICPKYKFWEEMQDDKKSIAKIEANELVRQNEGWQTDDNFILQKEFTNNVSYEIDIVDYAGNKTKVEIDIVKATYINIIYASHNSEIGWSYGYGNDDIAGEEALKRGGDLKTEALAFNISGNIENDFVMAEAFVYDFWGEGSQAVCSDTGSVYNYGYSGYKSMASNNLVNINNEKYFQFGGSSINRKGQTDINGENPIDLPYSHNYGISSIKINLKDYSYYSIVYQIYVDEVGWMEPAANGEETMYAYNKPMSAIRISLIPKTEKENVIKSWQKKINRDTF